MARSVGRVGIDVAGLGLLTGPIVPNVFVNGSPIAVEFTPVAPHGRFPHNAGIMVATNFTVMAGGHYVVGTGDLATCGDPLLSTSNVYIA